ncbi:sigma-54-dependent Fis family transcriptional regulator [Fibrobacterales bacterium]|nr:sigma-54-dependent Fis family transcriptional regulator [Fibrobacterales bacterium]
MVVLLADPDKKFINDVLEKWSLPDVPVRSVTSAVDVISVAAAGDISVVFLSADFLWVTELDSVSYLKEHNQGVEIVVLCEQKNLSAAENSLSRGADSYLLKPVGTAILENAVRKVLQKNSNKKSYQLMETQVLDDLLGSTPEMQKILKTIYKIAPTTSTILITGESGTGKEFAANIIHRLSKRTDDVFLAVNCGAIPENIVESELFGSKKGAFTGATNKKGLLEEAEGGTLFLDEIAELSQAVQVKLLRFLQNREIRRVGETENRTIDVRIIAATNRNVLEEVKNGNFREDLYYRLNTFHLEMPPLRERRSVIGNLVKHFLIKHQKDCGKKIRDIDSAAQMALMSYNYPGNIRELENIIEHALVMAEGEIIRLGDLPEELHPDPTLNFNQGNLLPSPDSVKKDNKNSASSGADGILPLAEIERQYILKAYNEENNLSRLSKKLGISRTSLWRKIEKYKITI